MVKNTGKRSTRNVKSLKARGLTGKHAKAVKGGSVEGGHATGFRNSFLADGTPVKSSSSLITETGIPLVNPVKQ